MNLPEFYVGEQTYAIQPQTNGLMTGNQMSQYFEVGITDNTHFATGQLLHLFSRRFICESIVCQNMSCAELLKPMRHPCKIITSQQNCVTWDASQKMKQDRPVTQKVNGPDAHRRSNLDHGLANLNKVGRIDDMLE